MQINKKLIPPPLDFSFLKMCYLSSIHHRIFFMHSLTLSLDIFNKNVSIDRPFILTPSRVDLTAKELPY